MVYGVSNKPKREGPRNQRQEAKDKVRGKGAGHANHDQEVRVDSLLVTPNGERGRGGGILSRRGSVGAKFPGLARIEQ